LGASKKRGKNRWKEENGKMERKEIISNYDAVEKLVKIIEAEKEEPKEKNEYEYI